MRFEQFEAGQMEPSVCLRLLLWRGFRGRSGWSGERRWVLQMAFGLQTAQLKRWWWRRWRILFLDPATLLVLLSSPGSIRAHANALSASHTALPSTWSSSKLQPLTYRGGFFPPRSVFFSAHKDVWAISSRQVRSGITAVTADVHRCPIWKCLRWTLCLWRISDLILGPLLWCLTQWDCRSAFKDPKSPCLMALAGLFTLPLLFDHQWTCQSWVVWVGCTIIFILKCHLMVFCDF